MSSDDPRLRILNPAASELAEPVLAALDATTVVIRLGTDVTGSARVAAGALAAMAARLFCRVEVHSDLAGGTSLPANWWGVGDITDLVARAAALITPRPGEATRTITVAVGAAQVPDTDTDFGIGGGDYIAQIARHPVPVIPGQHHLGVHAAACLAISQVLGMVLRVHGVRVVELDTAYQLDLLTHQPVHAARNPETMDAAGCNGDVVAGTSQGEPGGDDRLGESRELVFAGAGSVGSSAVALTATALAPAYTGKPTPAGLVVGVVDLDRFDPDRNPFRYPALVGGETEYKAEGLAARLRSAGIDATGYAGTVGAWTVQRDRPGVRGLLVSSVDTLAGRLEVADVLAEQALSIGVSGLVLHMQRERMDGTAACPFCDYVDAAPLLTQADVYVELTGLDLARVLQLLDGTARLTEQDLAAAVATGKLAGGQADGLAGHRLEDLVNRVYAEASVGTSTGAAALTVAFPQVSWFAGVLAAVEIVKQVRGLPLLRGRVDVDLAGFPPGALRVMPRDPSGRCVCHSGVRRRTYQDMYPTLSTQAAPGFSLGSARP